MYFENEMSVTARMLDEILGRLDEFCARGDRWAVRNWYNQMPINVSRIMLQDAMSVLMHGPDADTIVIACANTRAAYDRATRLMIQLGAMWYIDLHGLSSNDVDDLWDQLENKYADYKTETGRELAGVFGIEFEGRQDYECCFDRFIDFRNHYSDSLTYWLIEHNDKELAAWWLCAQHEALESGIWPEIEAPERDRGRLRHEARLLANHLGVGAPLMRRLATLAIYMERGADRS